MPWVATEDLEQSLESVPSVCSWGPNRLDCFYRNSENHILQTFWDGSKWQHGDLSETHNYPTDLQSDIAAVSWGLNRIDCFYRGPDDQLMQVYWDGNRWQGPASLGGTVLTTPAVASWASGRLDCFYRGEKSQLVHKYWDGKQWSGEESLGGELVSAPAAVSWGPNRIDCFYRGADDRLKQIFWDGQWHAGDLGGTVRSTPTVASWTAGRLDCFYLGDQTIRHMFFDGIKWSEEDMSKVLALPPATSSPCAVSWGPLRIDCFYRNNNGTLEHFYYEQPPERDVTQGLIIPAGMRVEIVARAAGNWKQRVMVTKECNGLREPVDSTLPWEGIGHGDELHKCEAQDIREWIAWVQMWHLNPAVGRWEENYYQSGPKVVRLGVQETALGPLADGKIRSGDQENPGSGDGNCWVQITQKYRNRFG